MTSLQSLQNVAADKHAARVCFAIDLNAMLITAEFFTDTETSGFFDQASSH
jgi:hypothetical protein